MNKKAFVEKLLPSHTDHKVSASAFSETNIALIKYWGKRNQELNLPITSSFSISLPLGTHTTISLADGADSAFLNGTLLLENSLFYKRLFNFLDLFRPKGLFFKVETKNDLPTGAGLASSASGFSALVLALNSLFCWGLDKKTLSMLARLGSGSSARSLYSGFVTWHKGDRDDGLDSFATPYDATWPEIRVGLWILESKTKPFDSRNAMQLTVESALLYSAWPSVVDSHFPLLLDAISTKNFAQFGRVSEQNALSMHATMLASAPAICYFLPDTIAAMHRIWQLRKEGLEIYFTMDAGPNLKVLFLEKDEVDVKKHIPELVVVSPF